MAKRQISLGFIKPDPDKMEGDVIYVQLRKINGTHHLYAEAVSAQPFRHHDYSMGGNRLDGKDNFADSTLGEGAMAYTRGEYDFVNMLIEENDAELSPENRFREDGLALTLIMGDVSRRADESEDKAKEISKEMDAIKKAIHKLPHGRQLGLD